jgi:hypothetical protein
MSSLYVERIIWKYFLQEMTEDRGGFMNSFNLHAELNKIRYYLDLLAVSSEHRYRADRKAEEDISKDGN